MNKYLVIGGVLVVIVVGGIFIKSKNPSEACPPGSGKDRDITVVSKKLEWRFEPETITVQQCDRVHLKVINEDNFDHGVAIDALGVSQRLPANGSIDVRFVASKSGEFSFYCSVSCSDSKSTGNLADGEVQTGPYKGTVRGHFEHIGKFIVEAITSITN